MNDIANELISTLEATNTENETMEYSEAIELIDFSNRRNNRSIIDDMKLRYVFYAGEEIELFNLFGGASLSIKDRLIKRGRFNLLQPFPYIIRDESDQAMLVTNRATNPQNDPEDMVGKIEVTKTPYAQALQLIINYGDRGLRILNSITGLHPRDAVMLEQTLMPKVPSTVVDTLKDLKANGVARISSAGLTPKLSALAMRCLAEMIESCDHTIKYMDAYLKSSRAELAAVKIPGKKGKAVWDEYDDKLAFQLKQSPPSKKELEAVAAANTTNEANTMAAALVEAVKSLRSEDDAKREAAFLAMQERMEKFDALIASNPQLLAAMTAQTDEESPAVIETTNEVDEAGTLDEAVDESATLDTVLKRTRKNSRRKANTEEE
jgi:hypothetical protein